MYDAMMEHTLTALFRTMIHSRKARDVSVPDDKINSEDDGARLKNKSFDLEVDYHGGYPTSAEDMKIVRPSLLPDKVSFFLHHASDLVLLKTKYTRTLTNAVTLFILSIDKVWDSSYTTRRIQFSQKKDCSVKTSSSQSFWSIGSRILNGAFALITSIVTIARIMRNIPRRLTEGNIYSNPPYCFGGTTASQFPGPSVSRVEYLDIMKRMAEIEHKLNNSRRTHEAVPPQMEEMVAATLKRMEAMEQELSATKKALEESLAQQDELLAYMKRKEEEEKKKKWVSSLYTPAVVCLSMILSLAAVVGCLTDPTV
ncbi:hypothetical protein MLD38_023390 [Melastoma candidum]|uniref:Uncharacterized protein n=1 Tax=Melastoma candidum TaxID=119954 RepID=A0ACB9QLI2_9MYRT|nr:hypothetical protein MLD38_023390 [Melastoma candidum]